MVQFGQRLGFAGEPFGKCRVPPMSGGNIFSATTRSSSFAGFLHRAHAAFADEPEDFQLREQRGQFRQPRRNESFGRALRDRVFGPAQFEQAGGAKAGERAGLKRLAALRAFRSVCRILIHVVFIHTVSSEANHGRCDAWNITFAEEAIESGAPATGTAALRSVGVPPAGHGGVPLPVLVVVSRCSAQAGFCCICSRPRHSLVNNSDKPIHSMMPLMKQYWGRRQAVCLLAAVCALMRAAGAQGQAAVPDIGPTAERKWVDAWAVSYLPTTVNGTPQTVPTFHNQTLRLNMFVKLGGTALRVKLTNRFSKQPLVIGGAHVALRRSAGRPSGPDIVPETDHVLTFDGARTLKLEAGKEMWSDPLNLDVKQHQDVTVNLYLPESTTPEAFHPTGLKTQYVAAGDHCGDATLLSAGQVRTTMYFFVSDVQVLAPAASESLWRWEIRSRTARRRPTTSMPRGRMCFPRACRRCRTAPVCVINMGIGSNRLLTSDAAGPPGLSGWKKTCFQDRTCRI